MLPQLPAVDKLTGSGTPRGDMSLEQAKKMWRR